MENLIEELTKVNPSNLSEEGLKLFNKINEIIDENTELKTMDCVNIFELGKKSVRDRIEYDYIPKSLIKEKIEELKNTKGDFATYIATSERIAVLEEILKGENNE